MSDFTFLTKEQVSGSNQLDILKKFGEQCAITDFAILLGGSVSSKYYSSEGGAKKNRTGWWWTKTPVTACFAEAVTESGVIALDDFNKRSIGGRPAIPYLSISSACHNYNLKLNGIYKASFGEYPQYVPSTEVQDVLEREYQNGSIRKTGKIYTTDSINFCVTRAKFEARTFSEYEYNGSKYIRFVGDANGVGEILSNGTCVVSGNVYWVQVEPIIWLIDRKTSLAFSKNILFAGVQFNFDPNYDGDFENTDIKRFMDEYFSKEILDNKTYSHIPAISIVNDLTKAKKQNPYNFNFDEVLEEDIIKGAVESGVSVFLHGKSSDGKSARVKQLDPDCEIIYLRNATPESLNGKSVYNQVTGEMIDVPPTWFVKIKEKCEKEPDKLHIIFFDELTNALPSIQGMAFNIILDGEVNGKWKLPENARIVAAGNDLNDSLAANQMAEPLFNRFAHVYINTTVGKWLKWASEHHIHPAIYAYIAYKEDEVLRTEYNGEKPNADPRKWEMASKVLYKTGKPEMLRSLVGEEITREFIQFCNQRVITLDEVINDNYIDEDIASLNTVERYATAMALSAVDAENLSKVRIFISKLGEEYLTKFDILWCHGDDERFEILVEANLSTIERSRGIKK